MTNNLQQKSLKNKNCNYTVSLLTITQNKRFDCINILLDLIKNQTYKNIIEWIIVEGSKTKEEIKINNLNINNLIYSRSTELTFPIVYINNDNPIKLGELRNIGNTNCKGDITVCMDDDDYYFQNRVEHAVSKLSKSNYLIAGCSGHLMYDYSLNILLQIKSFGNFHSINSCMAWKKEYLLLNKHDSDKDFGEEKSFTKNFTQPMIQLDPESTVIISSHSMNTFSKKIFFLRAINEINNENKIIDKPITNYIEENIFKRYANLFIKKNDNDYDIVYMCGGYSIKWDPVDKKLGGSEQAVVNLSENWFKLGKSVIVYGEVPNKIVNGVVYTDWKEFDYTKKYKNIILWRRFGIDCIIPFNIKADMIILDVHDNFNGQLQNVYKNNCNKCDKIFLKSNYHKECFFKKINDKYNQDKLVIIPNGIRVEQFNTCPDNITRNPYRFCYCSCYTRGLDKLISIVWPIIYSYESRAELHVYYGMDGINDDNYKNYLRILLSQPGVMDHGRQPIEMIIREKYLSTFHFYISNTEAEIDCISIRESIVTGCIPLLSNFGVFKEREGFHIEFNNEKEMKLAAVQIISNFFKNTDKIAELKEKFKSSNTVISWNDVALKWLEHLHI